MKDAQGYWIYFNPEYIYHYLQGPRIIFSWAWQLSKDAHRAQKFYVMMDTKMEPILHSE
jgi:hypothetical protein